jgi:hypothetical protein
VGNKLDETDKRSVQTEDGEKLATQIGAQFMETSAKTDINVIQMFHIISEALCEQADSKKDDY